MAPRPKKKGSLSGALRSDDSPRLAYCRAAEIAVICSGVSLMTVPVVALNRLLMALTLAIALVISDADAPCLSDPRMWLPLAESSDPAWQPTQDVAGLK